MSTLTEKLNEVTAMDISDHTAALYKHWIFIEEANTHKHTIRSITSALGSKAYVLEAPSEYVQGLRDAKAHAMQQCARAEKLARIYRRRSGRA